MLLALMEYQCSSLACDFRGVFHINRYKEGRGLEWYLKFTLENKMF